VDGRDKHSHDDEIMINLLRAITLNATPRAGWGNIQLPFI